MVWDVEEEDVKLTVPVDDELSIDRDSSSDPVAESVRDRLPLTVNVKVSELDSLALFETLNE